MRYTAIFCLAFDKTQLSSKRHSFGTGARRSDCGRPKTSFRAAQFAAGNPGGSDRGPGSRRTVNLSIFAGHFPGAAQHRSNFRRLQRFFQSVRLDQAVVAQLVVRMLNLSRPKCLALDRTNWKVGCKDINILMLARRDATLPRATAVDDD